MTMMRLRKSPKNSEIDSVHRQYTMNKESGGQKRATSNAISIRGGRRRELFLCIIVIAQFLYIFLNSKSIPQHEKRRLRNILPAFLVNQPTYLLPEFHSNEESGVISRTWHSNGSPSINSDLKMGSCWCSADDYCMCTPSLAIDTILTSGPEHFWLVKRKDAGKYATMGGFVEVGETSAEAVARELMEEMNIDLRSFTSLSDEIEKQEANHSDLAGTGMILEGVYADPKRDHRRHTVSVVYSVAIPEGTVPRAGDDAAEVLRVHHDEIQNLDFFADHKTILMDYIAKQKGGSRVDSEDATPIKRDICA